MKKIFLTPIIAVATTATVVTPITLTSCNKKTPFDMHYVNGNFTSGLYNITKDTKYTYNGIYVVKENEVFPKSLLVLTTDTAHTCPTLKSSTLKIGDVSIAGSQEVALEDAILFTIPSGTQLQDKQSVSLEITYSTDLANVSTACRWVYEL